MASPTQQPPASTVRFNRWAVAPLVGIALALAIGIGLTKFAGPGRAREAALGQAAALAEAGKLDLAARHLGQYLALHPDDTRALAAQARLLDRIFKAHGNSISEDEALGAIRINERLLRLAGASSPEAEPARRRLAALYIAYSDSLVAPGNKNARYFSERTVQESRYGAAKEIAEALIAQRPDDAEAHRLLAMALDGLAVPSKPELLAEAFEAYHAALRLDPRNGEAAGRLALLYRDRYQGHDLPPGEREKQTPESLARIGRERALAVLDDLLAALPGDSSVRLIRYQFFTQSRADAGLARAEIRDALELDPGSGWVRLAAAEQSIRDGHPDEARVHIAAIAADQDEGTAFRSQILSGLAEFVDKNPGGALTQWQQSLLRLEGTNADLNWWMAYVQLRLGQTGNADPYIDSYRRLAGETNSVHMQFLAAMRHEQMGEFADALAILDGLRYDAADSRLGQEVPLAIGRCREALGDTEGALASYRQAQAASPTSSIPYLSIASVQARRDPAQALTALRKAYQEAPGAVEILVALLQANLLRMAASPPSERFFAEVDELLDELERIDPTSSPLALLKADRLVLDPRSEAGAAAGVIERAVARRPTDRSLWSAWAGVLATEGKVPQALEVLDRATKPGAAGDHASLRLVRARLLVGLARGREAQAALVADSDKLPFDQRGLLFEALGRLRMGQGDLAGAREAYAQWARISPGAPKPLMAMIEASVRLADRAASVRLAAELDRLGNPDRQAASPSDTPTTAAGRLARALIEVAFIDPAAEAGDTTAQRAVVGQLNGAKALLQDVPEPSALGGRTAADPAVFALRGQIYERIARFAPAERDENIRHAIANYKEAWDRGVAEVLPRLVDLLARANRIEEIDQIASDSQGSPLSRRLSAEALLLRGDLARGTALVNELAPTEPARGDAWRSRMLEMAGQFDELEAELRARAQAARAEDLDPWFRLIQFLAERGRPAAELDATVREFLARAKCPRPEILEAQSYQAARRWAAADQAYEKAAAARSGDSIALSAAADHFAAISRSARARELYQQALRVEPGARPIARQFAVFLSGQGDPASWEEAWALVRPEAAPADQAEDRLARAVVLARSGDPARREQALAALADLIADLPANHPTAASARDYMARSLLLAGQAQRAAFYASVSAGMPSGGAPDLALHAECLLEAGQLDDAETQLDQLFLLDPLDPEEARLRARLVEARSGHSSPAALVEVVEGRIAGPAAAALGRAAFDRLVAGQEGREPSPESLAAAERIARALSARDPGLGWMLARVHLIAGRPAEALAPALAAAEAADTMEADRIQAGRTALAAAAADRGLRDRAAAVVEAALKYAPNSPDLLYMRAVAFHEAGQFADEADTYRKILQLWPAGRPEADRVAGMLAWVLSESLEQPAEALPLVEDILGRDPANPSYLCTRGVVLLRLGKFDQAIADLERSCASGENPRRTLHLARAYRAAGLDDLLRQQVAKLRAAGLDPSGLSPSEQADLQDLLRL